MTSYPLASTRWPFVLAIVMAVPALAVQPHVPAGVPASALAQVGAPPQVSPAIEVEESKRWAASDPAFRAFVAEAGVPWSARWDRRTGHLSFASGSFPGWLPADHRARTTEEIASTRALLGQRARALMARHPDLLGIPPSAQLILDERRSVPVDDGRLWQVDFRVELAGVPVTDAHVSFRLNSGRLVQVGQSGLADVLEIMDVAPRIDASTIAARAKADLVALLGPGSAGVELIGAPQLELLPTSQDPRHFDGAAGTGLQYRLAWRMTLRDPAAIETWVVLHDAITGERLFVFDSNLYACAPPATPQGHVVGGVYTGPIETTPEVVRGMPFAEVYNGGFLDADVNGAFPFRAGLPASTALRGRYFVVGCGECTSPVQSLGQSGWPGPLDLGVGGYFTVGNGTSTKAARNAFYHLNVVRLIASKHLSDAAAGGLLTSNVVAAVNSGDPCNASYSSSDLDFGKGDPPRFGSDGCNDMGEISDLVYHEWGHALDDNTGGISDYGMSEGIADTVSFLVTHDPRMAPYFYIGDPRGIRNADSSVAGVRTWTDVDVLCPGRETHCLGEIYQQPWWDLAQSLRDRAAAAGGSEAAGWFLAERLFFLHLPLADTMDPARANNDYDAVTLVDDDDGNLANGIPDGNEIDAAFGPHDFVSPPAVADSAGCTPPPTPTVTLAVDQDPTTLGWRVTVSWTAVAGAVEYRVFRNETDGARADVPVGSVLAPGASFADESLTDLTTYRYRVMAFDANGCFSIGENVQATTIPEQFYAALDALTVDDTVGGNANGGPEPGETVALLATVRNLTGVMATNVVATLTSTHPGITVVQGTQFLGDMAPGAPVTTSPPHFVIRLAATLVACHDAVPLTFSFESPEGCAAIDTTLVVEPPALIDDLETDLGWVVDPMGSDDARSGIWERGVPHGTEFQEGADHTPGGTQCFVTGNSFDPLDPRDERHDAVDNGCTTLQSPTYRLGGQAGLTLSYWRALRLYGDRRSQLEVEISNDEGATWTQLERLTNPTGGPWGGWEGNRWARASFALDAVLGAPADAVVLRFTACDASLVDVLEAAIDDITFSGFPCGPPDTQPILAVAALVVGDSAAYGGDGNGNGRLDPGERVRLPVDLVNNGSAQATAVNGTLSIVGGPASITDADGTWPDIPAGQVETTDGAPPHFEIEIPTDVTCGSLLYLVLDVTCEGPAGSYSLRHPFTLMIGRDVDVLAFADDFEGSDNGFTHGADCAEPGCDDWHHSGCTGIGGWDPGDTLVPGGRIWGNDLGGRHGGRPFDGIYHPDTFNWLESPPIDCRGRTNLRLDFLRWLTVEDGAHDHARLLVNGTVIWENPRDVAWIDTAWTPVDYDIAALADGNASVVIRFELDADHRHGFGGWNIDDLRVFSAGTECEAYCRAPPLPPAIGPVLRATPNHDDNGAEYSWAGAPLGPAEEFRLYRGVLPTALGTLVTPAGHVATSYDDRAAPGPLYFYRLVRANCLGQEGPADP
jgi:hypothetical protein